MGIRDWEWWYLALVWLVALGLSAVVVPRLVRSLRAPAAARGGRGAGARAAPPAAPLPLWQALVWLLVIIAALVITAVWLTGRAPSP